MDVPMEDHQTESESKTDIKESEKYRCDLSANLEICYKCNIPTAIDEIEKNSRHADNTDFNVPSHEIHKKNDSQDLNIGNEETSTNCASQEYMCKNNNIGIDKPYFSGFEQSRIETDLMKNSTSVSNGIGSNGDDLKGIKIENAKNVFKDMTCGPDISGEALCEVATKENFLFLVEKNMQNKASKSEVKSEEETCSDCPVNNKNMMRNLHIENAHVDNGIVHNHLPGELTNEYNKKEAINHYADSSELKQNDVSVKNVNFSTDCSHVEKGRKIELPSQEIQKPIVNLAEESDKNVNNIGSSSKIQPLTSAIIPVCQNSSYLENKQECNYTLQKTFLKQPSQKDNVLVSPKKNDQSNIEEKGLSTDIKLKVNENVQKLVLRPVSVIIKRSAYLENYIKENKINSSTKNNKKIDTYMLLSDNEKTLSVNKKTSLVDESQAENQILKREITYSCSVCFFTTTDEGNFTRHIREHPINMLTSWCKECHKMFRNFKGLLHHIHSKCSGSFGRVIKCGVASCSFETKSPQQFYHHNRFKHRGALKLNCSTCDKFFSTPQCLVLHVQDECLKNVDNQLKKKYETLEYVEKKQDSVSKVINDSPGKLNVTEQISDEIADLDTSCQKDTKGPFSTLATDSKDNPDDPKCLSDSDSNSMGDNVKGQTSEKEKIAVKSLNSSSLKSRNIIHTSHLHSECQSKSIPTTLVLSKSIKVEQTGNSKGFPIIQPSASKGNSLLSSVPSLEKEQDFVSKDINDSSGKLNDTEQISDEIADSGTNCQKDTKSPPLTVATDSEDNPDDPEWIPECFLDSDSSSMGDNVKGQTSEKEKIAVKSLNSYSLNSQNIIHTSHLHSECQSKSIPTTLVLSKSTKVEQTGSSEDSRTLQPSASKGNSLLSHLLTVPPCTMNLVVQNATTSKQLLHVRSVASTSTSIMNSNLTNISTTVKSPRVYPDHDGQYGIKSAAVSQMSTVQNLVVLPQLSNTVLLQARTFPQPENLFISSPQNYISSCSPQLVFVPTSNILLPVPTCSISTSTNLKYNLVPSTTNLQYRQVHSISKPLFTTNKPRRNVLDKEMTLGAHSSTTEVSENLSKRIICEKNETPKKQLCNNSPIITIDDNEKISSKLPCPEDKSNESKELIIIEDSDSEDKQSDEKIRICKEQQLNQKTSNSCSGNVIMNRDDDLQSNCDLMKRNDDPENISDKNKIQNSPSLETCENKTNLSEDFEHGDLVIDLDSDSKENHFKKNSPPEVPSLDMRVEEDNEPIVLKTLSTELQNHPVSSHLSLSLDVEEENFDYHPSKLFMDKSNLSSSALDEKVINFSDGEDYKTRISERTTQLRENAEHIVSTILGLNVKQCVKEISSNSTESTKGTNHLSADKTRLEFNSEKGVQMGVYVNTDCRERPLERTHVSLPSDKETFVNTVAKTPQSNSVSLLPYQKTYVTETKAEGSKSVHAHLDSRSFIESPKTLENKNLKISTDCNNILTGSHSNCQVTEKIDLDKLYSSEQPSGVATVCSRRISSQVTPPKKTAEKLSTAVTAVSSSPTTQFMNPKFPCVKNSSILQKNNLLPRFSPNQKLTIEKAINQNEVCAKYPTLNQPSYILPKMPKVDSNFPTFLISSSQAPGNHNTNGNNILTGLHSQLKLLSSKQPSQVTTVCSRRVSSQITSPQKTAEKVSPAITAVLGSSATLFLNPKFPCVKNSSTGQKKIVLPGFSSCQKSKVKKVFNQNEVPATSSIVTQNAYIAPKMPKVNVSFPTFLISTQVPGKQHTNSNNISTGLHSTNQVTEKSELSQLDKLLSSKQPSQVTTVCSRRVSNQIISPQKTAEKVSPAITAVSGSSATLFLNPKFPCVKMSSTGQKKIVLPEFSSCQKSKVKKVFNQNEVPATSSIATQTANVAPKIPKVDTSFPTLLTPSSQVPGKHHTALCHKPLKNSTSDSVLIQNRKSIASRREIPIAPCLPATSHVGQVGNSHAYADTSSKHVTKVIGDKHKHWEKFLYSLKPAETIYEILKEENNVKFFKCTNRKCVFTTDNSTQYEEHLKIHKDKILPCPYCFITFKATKLTEHVLKKHWKLRYQCNYCWYRGWGKAHVRTHTRKAHPEKPLKMLTGVVLEGEDSDEDTPDYSEVTKPYFCALGTCGFSTFDPSEFKKHYNTTHKTVSIFPCYYCKTEVISFERLLKHLKFHGINNFQCTFCLHGTETQEEILDHMTSTHPDKPLQLYVRGSMISSEKNTSVLPTSTNSSKELTVPECTSIQPQLEHSNKNSELGSPSNSHFPLPHSKNEDIHKRDFVIHDPISQRKKEKSALLKNITTGNMLAHNKHLPVSETVSLSEVQMKQSNPDKLFSDEFLTNKGLKEVKLTPCSSSESILNVLKTSKGLMNCSECNEEEREKNLNIKSIDNEFQNLEKKSLTFQKEKTTMLEEEYDRPMFPKEGREKTENKMNILREPRKIQQYPSRSLNNQETVSNSETFDIKPLKSLAEEERDTTEQKQNQSYKLNLHSWSLDSYKTLKPFGNMVSTEVASKNDGKVLDYPYREQEILPDDNFSGNNDNNKIYMSSSSIPPEKGGETTLDESINVDYSDRCKDESSIYQQHETCDKYVTESHGNIIKPKHSENTVYVCTLCSVKMYKHKSIAHHLETVHCTHYRKCEYCSLSGTSLVTLIKHSLKCHKDKNPKIVLLYQKIKQEKSNDLFEKEIKPPADATNKGVVSSEEKMERELPEVNAERSVCDNYSHALKRKLERQDFNSTHVSKNAKSATEDSEFQNIELGKLEKENEQQCYETNISENESNMTIKSNFQKTYQEDDDVSDVGKLFFADNTLFEDQHQDLFTCPFCNYVKTSFCVQKLHMFQELNYSRLLCLVCGMQCFNIKEIEDHFQKHHPDEKLSYQQKCDINTERLVELFLISQKKIGESKVLPLSLKQTLISLKQCFENCHHEKKQKLLLSCEKAIAALEESHSLNDEVKTEFLFDENGGEKLPKVEIMEERTEEISDLCSSVSKADATAPKRLVDPITSQFSSIANQKVFSNSDLDKFKKESVHPVAKNNFENKDKSSSVKSVQNISENLSTFNTECSRTNETKQSVNSAGRTLSMLKKAQTKKFKAKVILFTCPFCEYTQTSYHYQKLHIYRELKYRKMLCLVCRMKCFNMKELKTHFHKHHPDHKLHFERLCDINTEQWVENLLRNQSLSQKPNNRLKSQLTKRIQEYKYVCVVCGAKQRGTTDLQRHLFRHKQYRPVKCCHCNKRFICSTDAKRHSAKLHPGQEPHCTITRIDSIEDWVNEIIGSQQSCNQHENEVECATNLEKRNSEGDDVLVKKSMRVKNNVFACQWENCKFVTDDKKKLKYHLMIHFSKSKFPCLYCRVSFNSEAKLKSHCEINHSKKSLIFTTINTKSSIKKNNIKPKKCFNKFTCHYCGRSVYSKKGLRTHILWKHRKEFEQDENAVRETNYDIAVTSHSQTFSQEEPFECEWCGIRLIKLQEILEHMKSHDDKISRSTVLSTPVSNVSSGNNQNSSNRADVEGVVKETNSPKLSLFDQVQHEIPGISYSDINLLSDELPIKNIVLKSVTRCAYCRKNVPSDTIKQHCRKQHPNLPVKIIKHRPKATPGSSKFFRNSNENRTIENLKIENKKILLSNSGEHLYLCDKEPYRCEYCPAQFSSVRNLHKHWQQKHQTKSMNHSSKIVPHGLTQEQSTMYSSVSNIPEKLQIKNSARKSFIHLVDSQLQKNALNRISVGQQSNAVDNVHPNISESTSCTKRRLSHGSDKFTCDSLSEFGFSVYGKKQKLDTSNIKVNIPSLGAKIPYQSVLHLCNLQPRVILTDLKSQLFNLGVF